MIALGTGLKAGFAVNKTDLPRPFNPAHNCNHKKRNYTSQWTVEPKKVFRENISEKICG